MTAKSILLRSTIINARWSKGENMYLQYLFIVLNYVQGENVQCKKQIKNYTKSKISALAN